MNRPERRAHSLVGRRIAGRYHVESLVGSGGFGAVYRATHLELGTPVAIKVVLRARPHLLARFRREARAQDRLQSRFIVRLKDFGRTEDGLHYMVQSFVEGETLLTISNRGPLEPQRAVRVVRQVCQALAEAHDAGIVHRDIKPGNVMVTDYRGAEEVRLLDFGVARLQAPETSEELTLTGQVFGTVAYMAPEQLRGLAAGPAADIYSAGALLYVLLTGDRPYTGDLHAVAAQHLDGPLPTLPSHLPRALEDIIRRAMAKSPAERFADAEAMGQALDAVYAAGDDPDATLQETDLALMQRMQQALAGAPATPMRATMRLPPDQPLIAALPPAASGRRQTRRMTRRHLRPPRAPAPAEASVALLASLDPEASPVVAPKRGATLRWVASMVLVGVVLGLAVAGIWLVIERPGAALSETEEETSADAAVEDDTPERIEIGGQSP